MKLTEITPNNMPDWAKDAMNEGQFVGRAIQRDKTLANLIISLAGKRKIILPIKTVIISQTQPIICPCLYPLLSLSLTTLLPVSLDGSVELKGHGGYENSEIYSRCPLYVLRKA